MKLFRTFFIFLGTVLFIGLVSAQSQQSNLLFRKGMEAYRIGNYQEAIRLFSQCKELDEKELPPGSNRLGYSDMWISSAYYNMGDTARARLENKYYYAPPIDRDLTTRSDSLARVAEALAEAGKVEETLACLKEVAEIEREALGDNHPWYANSLCNIGSLYYELDDYASAADYFNRGIAIHQSWQVVTPAILSILQNGVVINFYAGNTDKALDLSRQRLDGSLSMADVDSLSLAGAYCDYALVDYNISDAYARCISNQEKGLDIYRRILPYDSDTLSNEENMLAKMYHSARRYKECAALLQSLANRLEQVKGRDSDEWIEKADALAYVYNTANEPQKAMEVQQELVDVLMGNPGRKRELAAALDDLARFTQNTGSGARAVNPVEESLQLYEALGDTASSAYMSALNTAATVYAGLLLWNKASEHVFRAREIGLSYGLENDPEYTRALNICMLMAEKAGLNDVASEINMQLLSRELGNENGVDSLALATSLQNQASILTNQGNYEEALQYNYMALTIRHRNLPRNHPDLASSFNSTAIMLSEMGDLDEAIRCMDYAINIFRTLGKLSNFPQALRNRGYMHLKAGNKEQAMKDLVEAMSLTDDLMRSEFSYLSPLEQKYFWRDYRGFYEKNIPYYVITLDHPVMNSAAYDALLLSKGILLNTEISLRSLLLESNNPELIEKYNRMIALQEELGGQYHLAPSERTADVKALEKEMETLQRDLVNSSRAYGEYTRYMSITRKDIQQQMDPEDVAVEFMRIEFDGVPTSYAALVVRKNQTFPTLVRLCSEEELAPYAADPSRLSDGGLYRLVWTPLESYLAPGSNVWFSPAGMLHELSIENAARPDGGMPSDRCRLYRVSSTREIALSPKASDGKSALFGNINYDATVDDMIAASRNPAVQKLPYEGEMLAAADNARAGTRSLLSRVAREGDTEISPLPGTATEINSILPLMEQATKYEGNMATETMLKALSGTSPQLLHIATHGIYYSEADSQDSGLDFMMFDSDNSTVANREDGMLSRSALLMAGASNAFNNPEEIPSDIDDGVITAQEISLLDLRGLSLVTLSACDTGRGDINGDGVFGLQRGFKKAGAQSILMSLWKVDDNATCMLMTEFYKNWRNGMSKYDALQLAKEKVRSQPGWEDPRYWAAFILLDGNR